MVLVSSQTININRRIHTNKYGYLLASTGQTCRAACATQVSQQYCDATQTWVLFNDYYMSFAILEAAAPCLLRTLSGNIPLRGTLHRYLDT
jgi:hypothetical protein